MAGKGNGGVEREVEPRQASCKWDQRRSAADPLYASLSQPAACASLHFLEDFLLLLVYKYNLSEYQKEKIMLVISCAILNEIIGSHIQPPTTQRLKHTAHVTS